MEYTKIEGIIKNLKADTEHFITTSKAKNPKFSLEKTNENLSDNEREIRWHMNTLLLLEFTMAENMALKNKLKEANQAIDNLKLSNTVLTNSVSLFNDRLNEETKNVSEYLDDLNEGLIEARAEIRDVSAAKILSKNEIKNPFSNFKPPKFEGEKDARPVQFLRALREYVGAVQIKDSEFLPLLRTCLYKNAKDWLYLVDNKINDFDDFEILFKERFWNEPIKSQLYSRFEMGKWSRDLNKSRVLYAQELIGYAQELELKSSEAELIKKIGRHFISDRVIPTSIRMQNIDNYGKLFDLLQECDNDEEAYKERMAKKAQNKAFQDLKNQHESPNKMVLDSPPRQRHDESQSYEKGKYSMNFSRNNYYNSGYKNRNTNDDNQLCVRSIEVFNPLEQQEEIPTEMDQENL